MFFHHEKYGSECRLRGQILTEFFSFLLREFNGHLGQNGLPPMSSAGIEHSGFIALSGEGRQLHVSLHPNQKKTKG